MHVAFGRVRRKTEPTGSGDETAVFPKIDTYSYPLPTMKSLLPIREIREIRDNPRFRRSINMPSAQE